MEAARQSPGQDAAFCKNLLERPKTVNHESSTGHDVPRQEPYCFSSEAKLLVCNKQFKLFYSRCCAAPLRGIAPIATWERFVVYCSCKQIISAAPPGAAQRARGIAQAVTPFINPQALIRTVR